MEEHEKLESINFLGVNDRRVPWVGLTCVGGGLGGKEGFSITRRV